MMLELRLFGTGQAQYCDHPLAGFPNQQSHRLFAYLLLNRDHPHFRERLAAVFWSEYPTAAARAYLRNALWRLRQVLQDIGVPVDTYLSITDDSVAFLNASPYWLDIQAFERAVSGCQDVPGRELTAEQATSLEEAVDLYAGDLLEGIYEDWCLYDRERLRLLHMHTLGKLVACHEHHGAYERGLAYGKQILARDPTREKVHRQMMRLYWLLGDRNEALTQYKCCAQILREELDIPPMEETRLLYKQMVRNQFDPTDWPPPHADPSSELGDREESVRLLAKHALQRLHRLQAMTDETSAELHQLERLISKTLTDARRA